MGGKTEIERERGGRGDRDREGKGWEGRQGDGGHTSRQTN